MISMLKHYDRSKLSYIKLRALLDIENEISIINNREAKRRSKNKA